MLPGTFVIRSPESSDVAGGVGVALILNYLNYQQELVIAKVLLLVNPQNSEQQALVLEGNMSQRFENVEQLLLAIVKDKTMSNGVQLLLPPAKVSVPSWSSPSLLRRGEHAC
jgi:hypothetical protein